MKTGDNIDVNLLYGGEGVYIWDEKTEMPKRCKFVKVNHKLETVIIKIEVTTLNSYHIDVQPASVFHSYAKLVKYKIQRLLNLLN